MKGWLGGGRHPEKIDRPPSSAPPKAPPGNAGSSTGCHEEE